MGQESRVYFTFVALWPRSLLIHNDFTIDISIASINLIQRILLGVISQAILD